MNTLEQKLQSALAGAKYHKFRLTELKTLILYFQITGDPSSTLSRIWIDCPWRILRSGRIILGSNDEPTAALPILRSMPPCDVQRINVDPLSGDLQVLLEADVKICTFSDSLGYELWELRHPNGLRLGVGENLSPFEQMLEPDDPRGPSNILPDVSK